MVNTRFAFVAYPVSDISASRRFYDAVLGKEARTTSDDWLEYELGDATFAITRADADHPAPVRGALLAFEVADLEGELARIRGHAVAFRGDIVETEVCRFIIALDPDESEFLIHQRKLGPDATPTI